MTAIGLCWTPHITVACAQDRGGSAEKVNNPLLPHVEFTAGVVSAVSPNGEHPAMAFGIQGMPRATRRVRAIFGLGFVREFTSYENCCGPNPGYTYREEAVRLSMGAETVVARRSRSSSTIDVRYDPTWYHTVRRGDAELVLPPPSWKRSLSQGSVGATLRWSVAAKLHPSLSARIHVNAAPVTSLGLPRANLGINLGVGW